MQQKEIMGTYFERADLASTDIWFRDVSTILKKHQNPAKKLQSLILSHGLNLIGSPRKKLLAIFTLLVLAKHSRLP